jgi:hypothetical protein
LFGPHSVGNNNIGKEDAQQIGEALLINKTLTILRCAFAPCDMLPRATAAYCAHFVVSGDDDANDCFLFNPRSLRDNKITSEGAEHICEALKINKALTDLWCVLPPHDTLPRTTATRCARFVVCTGAGSRDCSLFGPCRLADDKIGAEGAKHIGEALEINKTLTDL